MFYYILGSIQVDLQPLHCACQAGQTEAVKVLIGEFEVNPNATAEVCTLLLYPITVCGIMYFFYDLYRVVYNQSTLQL